MLLTQQLWLYSTDEIPANSRRVPGCSRNSSEVPEPSAWLSTTFFRTI